MLQPTGPQDGAGPLPPEEAPTRAAAGRDITRETRPVRQVGQATSASSDFRMISVSKTWSQAGQVYS
jgi:hypothetical protein